MHEAVLKRELLELLKLEEGKRVLDGTIGYGGHAQEILKKIGPKGLLIGIDRDREAIEWTRRNLRDFGNLLLEKANYSELDRVLSQHSIDKVDAVLLDLGVSLEQLRNPVRGFSFLEEGPLDMRMDPDSELRASDLLKKLSEKEIETLIREGGEDPYARRIAKAIVEERRRRPLETTRQLADLVISTYGRQRGRIHPATRTFQALRIAVNQELHHLARALPKAFDCLKSGGRIAVISFHSLEDRIVKRAFKEAEGQGLVERVTRKPIRPTREECLENPRARSAKLRVAEKR